MVNPFFGGWESGGKEVLQTSTRCQEALQKSTLSLFNTRFNKKGGELNEKDDSISESINSGRLCILTTH
jgi:hypothetical protein